MSGMIMAIDIGTKRTGVALANLSIAIPAPLLTLHESDKPAKLAEEVAELVREHNVSVLVIGLPRNMNGEKTDQTRYVEVKAAEIKRHVDIPVHFTDEAVTSVQAENELKGRKQPYRKDDIDMLSAVYILEDFLQEHPEVRNAQA